MSFKTTAYSLIFSVCVSYSACATQTPTPTQPEAQFELAQSLALTNESASRPDVRYWLEQSAHQGFIPAQKQLAEDYARGLTGRVDFTQAVYWFTSVALNDPQDCGFLLASFVEHHQTDVSNADLIEAWYQLAALKNPKAEQAYNQFLEQRFNQLRAKQLSEIVTLDKEATDEEMREKVEHRPKQNTDTHYEWYTLTGIIFVILLGFGAYRRHTIKTKADTVNDVSESQRLQTQVNELQFTNKQLKRQLEKVFKEFKKIKSQSESQTLAIACATFGYTPHSIPDSKALKLRYRQLSKLYHPDSRGSQEEMKRLNHAFNVISQNVTK